MKILLVADLHSQKNPVLGLKKILSKNSFDLILSVGDIADLSDIGLEYFNQIVKIIKKSNIRFLGVPGNNDSQKVFFEMVELKINIHLNPQKIGGYTFYGIGGWGFDNEFPMKNPKKHRCDQKTIFVSHIPPKTGIIKKIKNRPLIHICGHLHWLAKTQIINGMLLINVPSLMSGRAAILELPSKKIKFIKTP